MSPDDFEDEDDEELFKRFSSKNNENYRKYGEDKSDDMKFSFEDNENDKEQDNYDERKDYLPIAEDSKYGIGKENPENDFFNDSDFEFKDYGGDEFEEGDARSQRVRKRRRKARIILSAIIIMCILVVVAVGVVFGYRYIKNKYFSGKEQASGTSSEAIVVPSSLKLGKDMNFVIAGAGSNLLQPVINSIMLSNYTSSKSELVTLYIPVNTLMEVPGFGLESIDKSVENGGMDLLKMALKNNIGMDVNNYILIDVIDAVNKLEGIKINLNEDITINGKNGTKIGLKKGENLLDGDTALSFLTNFSGWDTNVPISNIEMQKILFDSLAKKIVGSNESDLEKNLTKIKDYIDSDLKLEDLSGLFATIAGLGEDKNMGYVLEGSTTELEGKTYYIPDISKVADIFKQQGVTPQTQETAAAAEVTLTMSILNGVGTNGIAAKTSEIFKGLKYADGKAKYDVKTTADADNHNYTTTQIILKSGDSAMLAAAEDIKNILKAGDIKTREGSSQETDVVIIIGKDFDYDKAVASLSTASTDASSSTSTETTSAETTSTTPADNLILINVLNGEGVQGAAAKAAKMIEDSLNKTGDVIKITETKNADNSNYKQTKIIIFTDKKGIDDVVSKIKSVLGVGAISHSTNNVDKVDITIILGSDFTK